MQWKGAMRNHRLAIITSLVLVVAMSLPTLAATALFGPLGEIEVAQAQDGAPQSPTPPSPAPTGELVVVPGEVQVGQTTLAVGFHVVPRDTEVVIQHSEHFEPEGEACGAGAPGSTQSAAAPTWVTLNACSVGKGYVRLVASATGQVIEEVDVTITPSRVARQASASVSLSDVTSADLVPGGSGDEFLVSASGLESSRVYELNTIVLNGISAAFDRDCSDFKATSTIRFRTSVTRGYTAFGCAAPGSYLWAWVEEVDGPTIASSGLTDHFLNVADPTVSFSSSSYSVDEGASTTTTVSLSHPTGHRLRIPVTVARGTAESEDYSVSGLTNGRLTFEPHDTEESFNVSTTHDDGCADEEIDLSFGTLPSHVSEGSQDEADIAIVDDEVCVSFGPLPDSVSEGSRVVVRVELSKAPGRRLGINVRVSPGSVRTVNFSSSATSRTFTYFPISDTDCEDEEIELSFVNLPSGVVRGSPHEDAIDILDDEVCVSFGSSSYSVDEGSSRSVRVELNRAPGRRLSIPVNVNPGSDQTITFSSSATSRTFSYFASHDPNCGDEVVRLSFVNLPSGVVEGSPNRADITVRDDDQYVAPVISGPATPPDYAEYGRDPVADYDASASCGSDITWSLPNTRFEKDRNVFSISSGGVLRFDSPPDYESPDDLDGNNEYLITVTARDDRDGTDDLDVTVTVTVTVTNVNESPRASAISSRTMTAGTTTTIDLSTYFSDPDGDALNYTAGSSNTGVATTSVSGSSLSLSAVSAGSAAITVTAADRPPRHPDRRAARQAFTVTVQLPPLDKVTGLTATSGAVHGEIVLDWDPLDGADNYEVGQWRIQPGADDYSWEVLDDSSEVTINVADTSAVVYGLTGGITYEHSVRGVHGAGSGRVGGPWADGEQATAHDDSPDVPANVEGARIRGGRGITLSWDPANRAQTYEVEVSFGARVSTTTTSIESVDFLAMTPDANYFFRVRSLRQHGSSNLYSAWSATVGYSAPTPTNNGHQEDHTVAYVVGSITAAPGLPVGVPDPARVIRTAIAAAETEWNTAASAIAGKNLKICEAGSCGGSNHDSGTTTIKTVVGTTTDVGDADSSDHNKGCGSSMACVKSPTFGQGNHLGDMSLVIEEPAWECRRTLSPNACDPSQEFRVYWTDVSTDHSTPAPNSMPGGPPSFYYYIGAIMTHEFGHTFGLTDFGTDDPSLGIFPATMAIMFDLHVNKTVTDEDIAQLGAIYAVHDSADH